MFGWHLQLEGRRDVMLGMKPHGTEWRLDRKVMVGPREKDERETEIGRAHV